MAQKTYIPQGETPSSNQIGTSLEALCRTISARQDAGEESYTYRLLTGSLDALLKKVAEESLELALAAKDVESQAISAIAAALAVQASEASGPFQDDWVQDQDDRDGRIQDNQAQDAQVQDAQAQTGQDAQAGQNAQAQAQAGQAQDASSQLSVPLPSEYDAAIDHLRYEAADVVYHLLVLLERFGVSLDEFAAELNTRMTEEERPEGAVVLKPEHVRRR